MLVCACLHNGLSSLLCRLCRGIPLGSMTTRRPCLRTNTSLASLGPRVLPWPCLPSWKQRSRTTLYRPCLLGASHSPCLWQRFFGMHAGEMIWIGLLIIFPSLLLCINKGTRWREWNGRHGGVYIYLSSLIGSCYFLLAFSWFLGIIALSISWGACMGSRWKFLICASLNFTSKFSQWYAERFLELHLQIACPYLLSCTLFFSRWSNQ